MTTNVYAPDYLVVCDAGLGLPDSAYPWFWPSRMKRSFEAVFRKAQDATRKRLHELAESGRIEGFIMPYLGQQDAALPWVPSELPSRESVYGYPTDFRAVSDSDLQRLGDRGEFLTRMLLSHYHPEL